MVNILHLLQQLSLTSAENNFLETELDCLIKDKVIEKIGPIKPPNCFVNNFFLRPKSDGNFRFILNCQKINEKICYEKFCMEGLPSLCRLITPNCVTLGYTLRISLEITLGFKLPVGDVNSPSKRHSGPVQEIWGPGERTGLTALVTWKEFSNVISMKELLSYHF